MPEKLSKLISVIVPIYNSKKYLRECLDSILGSTYKNLEIICVDDGSSDGSGELVKSYSKYFSNIILITQENAGVSAARNTGLEKAHGEYIAFIDSDDTVSSVFFENMLNACELHHADIAVCQFNKEQLPDKGTYTGEFSVCSSSEYYRNKHSRIYVITKLYRRDILNDIVFEKSICYAEDIAFTMDVLCTSLENSHKLICVTTKDELYYYRQNDLSLTHTYKKEDWLPLCMYLEKQSNSFSLPLVRNLYAYDALKKYLVLWYDAFTQKDEVIQEFAEAHMKKVSQIVKYEKEYMEHKDYVSLKVFSTVPVLYTLFRKVNDKRRIIRH